MGRLINNPVDRAARDAVAEGLRGLISGRLSNDEYEDTYPAETDDPVIEAIYQTAWYLYSDTEEYRMKGAYALHPSHRREALRWLLFLDSNRPYVWPKRHAPGWANRGDAYKRVSLFGGRARAKRFFAGRDHTVWPFPSRAEFAHALCNPKRLSGYARKRTKNDST